MNTVELEARVRVLIERYEALQNLFAALWPRTRKFYVIEDTVTSSRPGTEWAIGNNTVEWLKTLPEKVTFYGDLAVIER